MHPPLLDVPELASLEAGRGLVRIPVEQDVPFTRRVRALVDTREFQRLKHITQLGLASRVYPGATHTRFEHALGVFHNAIRYLLQLGKDARFREIIDPHRAEVVLAAALLHDLGHWPFCHPIEDMSLPDLSPHEEFAAHFLGDDSELAGVLRQGLARRARRNPGRVDRAGRFQPGPPDALSSLRSDRHRQDGLPRPRQPARGCPLRPQFRSQPADPIAPPESRWRRAGDFQQGKNGRRADGLRPLRDVQRGLLAPRGSRGNEHVRPRVLRAAAPVGPQLLLPEQRTGRDRRSAESRRGDSLRAALGRHLRCEARAL